MSFAARQAAVKSAKVTTIVTQQLYIAIPIHHPVIISTAKAPRPRFPLKALAALMR